MLNSAILLKVKERLNKLASLDYDNIQNWQIVEAFCKGQVDWTRRNLHGLNIVKEGDEQSTRRLDDLEVLITTIPLTMADRQTYYESNNKPADYMQWKRITGMATKTCCPKPKRMVVYLAEQGNLDELLRDNNKKPSYDWGETFCTLKGGKIQIYTNGEFAFDQAQLTYYRQPRKIQIAGVQDPYTGVTPVIDVLSEFKDDLIELLIDEAVKILAGDIESGNQSQRSSQAVENDN
jgi:hypothetical protein